MPAAQHSQPEPPAALTRSRPQHPSDCIDDVMSIMLLYWDEQGVPGPIPRTRATQVFAAVIC
jgi:hypothetical protein